MKFKHLLQSFLVAAIAIVLMLGFANNSAFASTTWNTTAVNLRGQINQQIAFDCPPNGSLRRIWGTDVYTNDSSICSAAVHAGLISLRYGGRFTIKVLPGASSYTGTVRNGVSSQRYGKWGSSYSFVSATNDRRRILRGEMGIGSTSR